MTHCVVTPVDPGDKQALQQFIDLPKKLHAEDKNWVAALDMEQRELLTAHNPFFRHGRAAYWVAQSGNTASQETMDESASSRPGDKHHNSQHNGAIVGRISAQVDNLRSEVHGGAVGYFGMFECIDDPDVAAALFAQAENWLREQGCDTVHGPFNLSINSSCGLLVDGYDTPPFMMMGHDLPYYPRLIEQCGYHKAKDLLAYFLDLKHGIPPLALKLRKRFADKVELRDIRDYKRPEAYALMRDIFNDAWLGNWGFVPFTEEEFNVMGKNLNLLMDPRQAQLAYVDGEAVGMMVTLPDLNEALRGLDGRLLPLGWARLLWRLKVTGCRRVRVPLMGVRRQLHGTSLAGGVAFMMLINAWELAWNAGCNQAELSWILEDNKAIKDVIERVGGVVYKRYRIYEKAIASQ